MRSDPERREELAHFLKTRRARVTPGEVGLVGGGRRRTPGLRREEVAQIADIGLTWYTWMEQGREISVSTQVLERIAEALRLDTAERTHLFMLAHQKLPISLPPQREVASDAQRRLLHALGDCPGYILSHQWDILDWNQAAGAVFGDFTTIPSEDRNLVWYMFTYPLPRYLFADWHQSAQRMLALFRATMGCIVGNTALSERIECLKQASPEFRNWWPQHDISSDPVERVLLSHPHAGTLAFESTLLLQHEASGPFFLIYVPLSENETSDKLRKLLA